MTDNDKFVRAGAFRDGELSPSEVAEFEDLLKSDADLRQAFDDVEAADQVAKGEFAEMLEAPLPFQHAATLNQAFEARKKVQAKHTNPWIPAIAASFAAVMISAGVGMYMFEVYANNLRQEIQEARVSSNAMLASMFQDALENSVSGKPLTYQDPVTQIAFEFQPVKTYKSASGHWCREFVERIEQDGNFEIRQGVACRENKGRWYRLKTTIEGEMSRLL